MRENYRNPIASIERLPRFTTMNVIDGQAGLAIYASLIFYSLTIDNILNIIVLLILAGVSITMISSQDGILGKATGAKESQRDATELERVKLAVQSALLDGEGTVDLSKAAIGKDTIGLEKALKDEFGTGENSSYTTYEEGKVTLTNGDIYNVTESGSVEKAITFKKTGDLAIGSEVTASNGEVFYIIGFSTDNTKVNLLTKYNLKKESTKITLKKDTEGNDNPCAFSDTNYWLSETSYPLDLNNYKLNDSEVQAKIKPTDAIEVAKRYGTKLGATGRLKTKEEADTLKTSANTDILYGNNDGKTFNYWLGFANNNVWNVNGENRNLSNNNFNNDNNYGVYSTFYKTKGYSTNEYNENI